ncbi:phage host-nuclease inhibitor protein Gam [Thermostichus sp. OS-CIW-31]
MEFIDCITRRGIGVNSQSQDRLDRVEQLLAWTAEQTAANSREIRELCQSIQELRQSIQESRAEFAEQAAAQAQSLRELQQVVSETRSDLAHLAEWAEEVTQALVTLTALQREHERAIQAINQRQAETDQRFNVLLEEVRYLIRRQGSDGNPPPSLP